MAEVVAPPRGRGRGRGNRKPPVPAAGNPSQPLSQKNQEPKVGIFGWQPKECKLDPKDIPPIDVMTEEMNAPKPSRLNSIDDLSDKIACSFFCEDEKPEQPEEIEVFADEKPPLTEEEKPQEKDGDFSLKDAVFAEEFVPSATYSTTRRRSSIDDICKSEACVTSIISPPNEHRPKLLRTPSQGEEQEALDVLKNILMSLLDDPGGFEAVVDQLTEHLNHFCTLEDTLKDVVNIIIGQALDEGNFGYSAARLSAHLDSSGAIDLPGGKSFRKVFFTRCQEEFKKTKALFGKQLDGGDIETICRCAMWFGELLVNMKINDAILPVFKTVVFDFVDFFLTTDSKPLLLCMTRLLKLVGPELDSDRPKDVETMFDKVRDFYFNPDKTASLAPAVKEAIWKTYKLHTRDWDRERRTSLPPPAPSAIDWNEWYSGDDHELMDNYLNATITNEDEDEFAAYEEFLKSSGQIS